MTWIHRLIKAVSSFGLYVRTRLGAYLPVVALLVPVVVLALLLAGYGLWWRLLADRVRETVVTLQAEQRTLGRNLDWDSLEISGFPYLVDATMTKAKLLAPDTGAAWDGERIVVSMKPLSLNTISFSLEGEQHFFYVGEGRWIEADARADKALVKASSRDTSQTISTRLERLTGKGKFDASDFNFIVEDASAVITLSAPNGQEALPRFDLSSQIKNVALQGNLELPLGSAIEMLALDVGVKLPAKLPVATSAAVVAAWRQTGTPIDIRRFELEWGGISIAAVGEIKFDARNLPEGRLRLTLGNHPRILELLEVNGWISRETRSAATPVLDVLAFVSGDPKRRVTVPLRFENGDVYLGPARVMTMQPPAPVPSNFIP